MNLKHSSLRVRSAAVAAKWELGLCARMRAHKRMFSTPSRSGMEGFTFRVGNVGKNILGEKGKKEKKALYKGKKVLNLCKTGMLPDIFPTPTFLHFTLPGY